MARGKKASPETLPAIVPPDDALEIVWWPIGDVKPYAQNPRKNDHAVEKVKRSIQTFGWRQPIVVDNDGVVIVGHTRLKAAEALDLSRVPIHIARGLTKAQARAYRLADNRTAEEAEWDVPALVDELAHLRLDVNDSLEALSELTAFDTKELERMLGDVVGSGGGGGDVPKELGIYVTCTDEQQQARLYDRLSAEGLICKLIA